MKQKRIVNKAFLKSCRGKPCVVSNNECFGQTVGHHVTSVGAGGNDTPDNVVVLCVYHHRLIHDKPNSDFIKKYKSFHLWLIQNQREDILDKAGY